MIVGLLNMWNNFRLHWCVVAVFCLMVGACEQMPGWVGVPDKKMEGKRIAILKTSTRIKPDAKVAEKPIKLPKPYKNQTWLQSSGHLDFESNHLYMPAYLEVKTKVSNGKGAEKNTRLNALPVVADRKIFIQDGHGNITARSLDKIKKKLWKTKLNGSSKGAAYAGGGMTYAKGALYVASGFNEIYSLEAATGNVLWKQTLKGLVRTAPLFHEGRLYVLTNDNQMVVIDANTGEKEWAHTGLIEQTSIIGSATPVMVDDLIIIPHSTGELYMVDTEDQKEMWSKIIALNRTNTNSHSFKDINVSPMVQGRWVYVASDNGLFTAVDVHTGTPLWNREIFVAGHPWVEGDFIYLLTRDNELLSLHVRDGAVKWIIDLPKGKAGEKLHWNGPVLAGDRLLLAGAHGELITVSPYTGQVSNTVSIPNDVYLPPVVVDGKVFVLNNEAQLAVMH